MLKEKDLISKFRSKTKFDSESGCWIYEGTNNPQGYGIICINGKSIRLHRWSYENFKGDIPEGLLVCHKCDNPACWNPEHLFVGTHQANMADMHLKRSHFIPPIHCRRCGYSWTPRKKDVVQCPRCKRYDWNDEK